MKEAEKQSPSREETPPEEYGWDFHKVPLLIAAILTVIFYVIVYWLASLRH